jgi:trk system potassium uptake protein TrkA
VKRITVIGLGNFGHILACRLYQLGHDVLAIDIRSEVVDAIGPFVTRAVVGDATNRQLLSEAGAEGADTAVVATGENLTASILSLLAVRDLGVKNIFVKVRSEDHARIVGQLGATDCIFPERESALSLASRVTSTKLLQYVQLGTDLSLQEMQVPAGWLGKTLRDLALPAKYRIQVVAVHDMLIDQMLPVPDPDRKLTPSDALLVAGNPSALESLASLN